MRKGARSSRPRLERAVVWSPALIDANVMFRKVRAAAVNFRPKRWDKAGNADRLEALFRKAANRKPDLIVGPEGVLEGYVVTDVVWHRERAEAMVDIAEPIDGPYIKRFRRLAKSLKTCLCFGFAERVGREVYNTAVFIDHRGGLCGRYHKVSEGTHPSFYFSRQGSTVRAFDTPLGRCGMLICSDRWAALTARTLVLDGAQFILIPTWGTASKGQDETVLARSRENGVPIVQANVTRNLIVSRGEIVGFERGLDRITVADIEVPTAPSRSAVLACECEVRKFQQRVQRDWYGSTMALMKKPKPPRSLLSSFVSEREFARLRGTAWGKKG